MADLTSDPKILTYDELLKSFGTSAPGGNTQVNSTKVPLVSTETLYCKANAYFYGCIKTLLTLCRGILLPAGSATEPSISFGSATGIYYTPGNTVSFTSAGTNLLNVGDNQISVDAPITTSGGNLVLDPPSGIIDLAGNTLIGIGGILITVGDPNDVIINDPAGTLSSEPQLSPIRGGTGINTSTLSGVARVTAGTWSVAPISTADLGTLTSATINQLTTTNIISPGNITISPVGTLNITSPITQTFGTSSTTTILSNVISSNATPVAVLTYSTSSDNAYSLRALITFCAAGNSGMFDFYLKYKNVSGVLTMSDVIQKGSIIDNPLAAVDVAVASFGTTAVIQVIGLNATTIKWSGRFEVCIQPF